MDDNITVGARLPKTLIAAIDAFAKSKSDPGLKISRSDAIRILLTRALKEGGKL